MKLCDLLALMETKPDFIEWLNDDGTFVYDFTAVQTNDTVDLETSETVPASGFGLLEITPLDAQNEVVKFDIDGKDCKILRIRTR